LDIGLHASAKSDLRSIVKAADSFIAPCSHTRSHTHYVTHLFGWQGLS
jgi:hypothetical protein